MTADPLVVRLLHRVKEEGPVLSVGEGVTGIFDPQLAQQAEVANAQGLKLPGSLSSLGRRREACEMSWREARALLIQRSRQLSSPSHLEALYRRMHGELAAQSGRTVDLVPLTIRTFSRALLPMILADLSGAGLRIVAADQEAKLRKLCATAGTRPSPQRRAADMLLELAAGRVVARQLKRRIAGAAAERDDYAQTLADLAARIGVARAAYLVSTLLTATASPPGLVASCLLYELVRRPEWRERIRGEMAELAPGELFACPGHKLAATGRFVREAMRLWAFPLVTHRVAYRDLEVGGTRIEAGCPYDLSPYLLHRSERHWRDPESFDPDRWLAASELPAAAAYVPFGFGPRSCVGASVGQPQMILFCHLATCGFEFALAPGRAPAMTLEGFAMPADLIGTVRPLR